MAIQFPKSIDPPAWPFDCEYENNSIISKFEDESQQSRRKFTRSRRKWTLKWKYLPRDQYLALMKFISETVSFSARSFNWENTDSLEEQYTVLTCKVDEQWVEFTLGTDYSARTRRPLNRYMKNNCPFAYKGLRCGYKGSSKSCLHTLADCRAHKNSKRFGGFPGIDQKGIYV